MLVLRSRLLDVVQETRESKASASVVYFELKLRFPAGWRTVAIGKSDGVSECRTGAP